MHPSPVPEASGSSSVRLGDREICDGAVPYVIAELSANHGGSLDKALDVVRAAAEAGVDAVKLQTYTADEMTLDLDRPPFVAPEGTLWAGRRLYDLYQEAHTPWEWHRPLFELATGLGLHCFSTPFDRAAVDRLEALEPPAYKIASFELLDLDLVGYAASTDRPLILSTGMASAAEIDDAVSAARQAGNGGVILLRCNSAYPANPREMDLATVPEMAARWKAPVGLSDHSPGPLAATVAAGLGASIIEKHLIIDRSAGGPDAAFSAEPDELRELVDSVRAAAAIRGRVRFGPSASETASVGFRRSLYVVADVDAGQELTAANVRAIRPAGGLPPSVLPQVLGRRPVRPLRRGDPLSWSDLV